MSAFTSAGELAYDQRKHWRTEAACRDVDPELFFPDGDVKSARVQVKAAKLICRGCRVRAICLSWALASGQEAGVWGGLTEGERHGLPGSTRSDWQSKPPEFPSAYPRYRSTVDGLLLRRSAGGVLR
jgi:WhiB family transcriptional regulator, redox-sensing transcriptional regulator